MRDLSKNIRTRQSQGRSAPYRRWGRDLDDESLAQMERACRLPVSLAGALMPDAHVGYGLPIGGVLATDNAVIPSAVGVDIACRMRLSVFDLPPTELENQPERFIRAIDTETRFGVGAAFSPRRQHAVMDDDWSVSPVTRAEKDRAWDQLGTSGSGNHFVEFGVITALRESPTLPPSPRVALLSHSGSRGIGAAVCKHYSAVARQKHPELPSDLRDLAWLDLESDEGREYWEAMELMGRYAAANHELIHRHIARHLGLEPILEVENHHNFAWIERHSIDGQEREVVVHRKGATPAGRNVLGVIPGSMASSGYLVRGLGCAEALHSASHGAGRRMSRTQARRQLNWRKLNDLLRDRGVRLLSAGLDESPEAYKDIEAVMSEQSDLVESLARFEPRIVRMSGPHERPED